MPSWVLDADMKWEISLQIDYYDGLYRNIISHSVQGPISNHEHIDVNLTKRFLKLVTSANQSACVHKNKRCVSIFKISTVFSMVCLPLTPHQLLSYPSPPFLLINSYFGRHVWYYFPEKIIFILCFVQLIWIFFFCLVLIRLQCPVHTAIKACVLLTLQKAHMTNMSKFALTCTQWWSRTFVLRREG